MPMTESSTKTFMIDIASFDYRLHVLKIEFMAVSSRPPLPPLLPREPPSLLSRRKRFFPLSFCAVQ